MFDISFYCNACNVTRCMNHIFVAINILNETEKRQRCLIIIFIFTVMYVRSLNYIFAAINMFTWKQKEEVVFDIVFRRIVIQCR